MKSNTKIILYITAIFTASIQCCENPIELTTLSLQARCDEIIIRAATKDDLNALTELSHKAYNNDFKSLWQKNYAKFTPSGQSINQFIQEKTQDNNNKNAHFIEQQKNNNDYCLLVATEKNENKIEQIAGFCRFYKKKQNMHMLYLTVDEQFRRQGIAKKLVQTAFKKWDTVTTCKFYLLIHHPLNSSNITSGYGCRLTHSLAYNFKEQKTIYDPYAPKTHNAYTYTIKK